MVASFKEKLQNRKLPPGHIRGIAFAVVNLKGELWVQQDMESKELTERQDGEFSIIFETQKNRGMGRRRESHRNNVLGAVPELVNDATLFMIKDKLVTTDRLRSTPELTYTTSGGTVIHYVVAVGVLDAPSDQFDPKPFDLKEIKPVGWMRPVDLLAHNNVRPLAREAVKQMLAQGTIDHALDRYHSMWHRNKRIIPRRFRVAEFHKKREEAQDMEPGIPYHIAV